MKKAILAVSFGTSHEEAIESCIRPVEDALRSAFPEHSVFRAFTSRMILHKLRSRGVFIESEEEAITRLKNEGYDEIFVVPTHIIPGNEYEKVRAAAAGLPLSAPLLAEESDLVWIAEVLRTIAEQEGRPLLLLGHGTDHSADEIYARLREKLPGNVFLACLEGRYTLNTLLPRLDSLPEKKLVLMPLMLVAGSHARRALSDAVPDSWVSILRSRGFDVRVRMQGLGSLPEVQHHLAGAVGSTDSQLLTRNDRPVSAPSW